MELNKIYSKKMCYDLCLQFELIYTTCGCTDPSIPLLESKVSVEMCNNLTSLTCIDTVRSKFDSQSLDPICSKYCPQGYSIFDAFLFSKKSQNLWINKLFLIWIECERFTYTTSVSSIYCNPLTFSIKQTLYSMWLFIGISIMWV